MANWYKPGDTLSLTGSYSRLAGQPATTAATAITPPQTANTLGVGWQLGTVRSKTYTNGTYSHISPVSMAQGPYSGSGTDNTSGWAVSVATTPTTQTYHCRSGQYYNFSTGTYLYDYHDYTVTTALAVTATVTVPGNPYRDNYDLSLNTATTEPNVTITWDASRSEWVAKNASTGHDPSGYNSGTASWTYTDPGTTQVLWGFGSGVAALGSYFAYVVSGALLTGSAPNTDTFGGATVTHPGAWGVQFDWTLTPVSGAYSADGQTAYQFATLALDGGGTTTDTWPSFQDTPVSGSDPGQQPAGGNDYSTDDTSGSPPVSYGVWWNCPEKGADYQIHPTGHSYTPEGANPLTVPSGGTSYQGVFPFFSGGYSPVTLDSSWQAASTTTYHLSTVLPTDTSRAESGTSYAYSGRPVTGKTLSVTLTTYTKVQQNVTPPGAPVAQTVMLTQDLDGRPCGAAAATLYSSKAPGPHGGPAFDTYPTGLGTSPADSSLVVDARTNQRLFFWSDGTSGLYRAVANQDGEAGGWGSPALVLAGATLTTITPSPVDPDRLLLAGVVSSALHLYESADQGQTWQSVSAVPGLNIATSCGRPALLCLGNHVGLAGPASSGSLVYVPSANGGLTWGSPVTVWTQPADTSSAASRVQSMTGHGRDGALFLAGLLVTNTVSGGVTTTATLIRVWASGDLGQTWAQTAGTPTGTGLPGLYVLRHTHRLLWSLTQYSDTAAASWSND